MLLQKTNLRIYYQCLILGIFILMNNVVLAQLSVKPDRTTTRYDLGETMNFRVTGAKNGTLNYEIKHTLIDTLRLYSSGTVAVVNGEASIPFTATEAGFVICKIKQSPDSAYTGAAFSPEKLQAAENEPADFDVFWANQKAALRAVPLDMHLTYIRTNTYGFGSLSNVFSFDIAIVEGRRAYGYLVVPISSFAPHPAIIMMPSFGHVANLVTDETAVAERAGVISIFLSPHNNPPNVTSTATEYLTDGLSSPSTYYIRYPLLGAVKVIDYLQTRADFNGQVGVLGISQGGGLAALTAGIDDRISLLAEAYSGFSHQVGAKYSQPSAFPYSYHTAFTPTLSRETIVNTTKYFDPVFALRRFKGVSWNVTSLKDDVCPPQAVMTAFNQLKGQRIIETVFEKLHVDGPDEFYNSEINNSVYAFFRRHFLKTRNAPWPYNPSTTGYVVDAGKDTMVTGASMSLTGFVGINNDALSALPVIWEKVEGGSVTFSNPTSRNTTVNFSQTGTYRFRFSGYDYSTVADKKYYTLIDDIVVTVSSLIPIELSSFKGAIKDKTNELTWITASEINNKGFEIERSDDAKRWQKLDFIEGKGNSSQLNTYNFTDNAPLSTSYYRLRQIDFNGAFKYSNIVSLIRNKNKEIIIYPNPALDLLTIKMANTDNSDIKIYDILGKLVLTNSTNTNETTLNISNLAKGNYFIEIKNEQLITIKKFIKN
jgi:cephalosporin-C deacetylase-like acetyl esterase